MLRTLLVLSLLARALAKNLWSATPVNANDFIREAYPLGNGRLGVLPAGIPGNDVVNINLDSLWYGGPFQNASYNAGNPSGPVHDALPKIRATIFETGFGDISPLWTDAGNSYGGYTPLANLSVVLDGIKNYTQYSRSLDLATATHSTNFSSVGQKYVSTVFCSYPDAVCLYTINVSSALPRTTIALQNNYFNSSQANFSCSNDALRFQGALTAGGMLFDSIAQLAFKGSSEFSVMCANGSLVIPANSTQSITLVLTANTDYDQTAGDSAHSYSFRGTEPSPFVESTALAASQKSFSEIRSTHLQDYRSLFDAFALNLPDPANSTSIETSCLIDSYAYGAGNPYIESLLFDYGRYLLISSSRPGSLPANLQGRWAVEQYPAWSGDYHVDVNLEMNYWLASQTGLGYDVQGPLFDYLSNTWIPYGQRSAELIYNVTNGGFVVHDEVNTFGFTSMKKGEPYWSDYPAASAWMAEQYSSFWSYYGNVTWYQQQGYLFLKGVALFWLDQLQDDRYFNDGTLVAAPCDSPEYGNTTLACTHYQHLIWEVFDQILQTWSDSGDTDAAFLSAVQAAYQKIDRGVHIGFWGELQEWKIGSFDVQNDTHRHLSHLVGWYPGYAVSSVPTFAANRTIMDAITTTLWSRGNGTGPDADAGWEKVWRAACWAVLNGTERAFFELSYAIDTNFAGNGLSMYSGTDTPFQIDANFGLAAAMLAMLARDSPQAHGDAATPTVVLGPAIPTTWAGGSVKGLRLRGGGSVDFGWDDEGVVRSAIVRDRNKPVNLVNVMGNVIASVSE